MERFFQIVNVTKTAQKGTKTIFDGTMVFSGDPRRAAMKAMTHLCASKKIRGKCTFTVVMAEVKLRTINGVKEAFPMFDSNGLPKMWKYDIKREKYMTPLSIELDGENIDFKYRSSIVKSHGRVVPT
jgi:hypothetical protein